MAHANVPVAISVIAAGKLRRYHGIPLWKQLLDIPTVVRNLADTVRIVAGFFQSMVLLWRFKPDVVFAKGGYVCLPLGYAARLLRIPLVIHDSDTRPGLTNRMLSRSAMRIATGSPLENYNYPVDRTVYTGVPVDASLRPLSASEQREAKSRIGVIDLTKPLIVVTGGGLGAASINEGMIRAAQSLLDDGYCIYHVTGRKHWESVRARAVEHPDYHIVDFVYKDMASVLGAADIVVSRGSATFLQELAALAKPTIVVPAGHLSDQVKNARTYEAARAVVVVTDADVRNGRALVDAIQAIAGDTKAAQAMTKRFHAFSRPGAAQEVARLILGAGSTTKGEQ